MSIVRNQGGSEKVTIDGEKVRVRLDLQSLKSLITETITSLYILNQKYNSNYDCYAGCCNEYFTTVLLGRWTNTSSGSFYVYSFNEGTKEWTQLTGQYWSHDNLPIGVFSSPKTLYCSNMGNIFYYTVNTWKSISFPYAFRYERAMIGRYLRKRNSVVFLGQWDTKSFWEISANNELTQLENIPFTQDTTVTRKEFIEVEGKLYYLNKEMDNKYNIWSYDGDAWSKICDITGNEVIRNMFFYKDGKFKIYKTNTRTLDGNYYNARGEEWEVSLNGEITKVADIPYTYDGYHLSITNKNENELRYFGVNPFLYSQGGRNTDLNDFGKVYLNGYAKI